MLYNEFIKEIDYMPLIEAITIQAVQDYLHYGKFIYLNSDAKEIYNSACAWLFDFIPAYCGCTKEDIMIGIKRRNK